MSDTSDKNGALSSFSNMMHMPSTPTEPSLVPTTPLKSDSRSAHLEEIDKLAHYLAQVLPSLSTKTSQHLGAFLLQAPLRNPRRVTHDVQAIVHREHEARAIADELINAGFGKSLHTPKEKPIVGGFSASEVHSATYEDSARQLAAILLKAPASDSEKVADRTLRSDFKDWKQEFVAALQGREAGAGRY